MFILFHFISHIYTQQTPSYTIVDLAEWVDVAQAHNSNSAINYFSSSLFSLSLSFYYCYYFDLCAVVIALFFLIFPSLRHSSACELSAFPLQRCAVLCSWNFLQFLQCWNLQQCSNDVKARSRTHETHSLWSKAASEKLTAHKVAEELFFRAHLGFWQCLSMITHSATETRWVHLLPPRIHSVSSAAHKYLSHFKNKTQKKITDDAEPSFYLLSRRRRCCVSPDSLHCRTTRKEINSNFQSRLCLNLSVSVVFFSFLLWCVWK